MSFLATVSYQAAGLRLVVSFVLHEEHQTGYGGFCQTNGCVFWGNLPAGQRPNANGAIVGPTGHVHPVHRGTFEVTFVVAVFT